ncbi:putative P-type ATPase, HAD superfamily, P-type ATPase, transmembrane domain superfamily [Septoria linicola]|nr:putative P-type ATPase, HAD superfamily, P-type ATPase, transmembrane domain superfamily [Septoria linicola]
MAIDFDTNAQQTPSAQRAEEHGTQTSQPLNRMRWATVRNPGRKGTMKRRSIFSRNAARLSNSHRNRESAVTVDSDIKAEAVANDGPPEAQSSRTIFVNQPLPDSARDDEGRPLQQFKRNKIRTAKYTPISFIPKNLWFQLHNIANVYFIFIVILGIFSIFGVENPGLAAVPIIVILAITAIKDAIEDWRRTVLDNELNNAPVHRLVDWDNVNVSEEKISAWRKFKKANTRAILFLWKWWKGKKEAAAAKKGKTADAKLDTKLESDERRMSALTQRLDSIDGHAVENADGDVEMTPVPSPTPGQRPPNYVNEHGMIEEPGYGRGNMKDTLAVPQVGEDGKLEQGPVPKKFHGSLINPNRPRPETARFKKDYWKNVRVGDFVRLYNDEEIPSDIIVLATSDADGACYIETKNLDGETNLKVRTALYSGRDIKRARDCEQADFVVESEPPHANLYAYSGVVRWNQYDRSNPNAEPKEMAEPVGINNLLLRGCTVRNTEWVLGVVAFTGEDTKIMLNSGITPSKRPKIMRDLNWNVLYNFIILFVMCLIAAIVNGVAWGKSNSSQAYFDFGGYGSTAGLTGFINFWAAVILFQNLVPISLYISLEIVRSVQAFFIYSDTYMYYEKLDYPCTPKSWNISDDLGQIEYIFSDKTGTLTQNVMEFKKCTVNGVPYGEAYTEALAGMQKRQGINVEEVATHERARIAEDRIKMLGYIRNMHNNPYLRDDDLTFVAPDYIQDLGGDSGPVQKAATEQFMLALALCHSVITERTPGDPPRIDFKAQSPDEAALVATARDCGYTVIGRSNDGIILSVLGEEREYSVLNILEFNSTRKRMSAIIRMPDGKIILFCKGADSIIYSRLAKGEQPELRQSTAEHLEMFAREGLRTLCIAQRELDEDEYQEWNRDHELAAAAVQDRETKLEEVADRIERDLTLLGGTAIEDRLQDGVPDSIALLAQAGIKLWVLTGDKVETAINIGFSCNLLDNDMDLIVLKVDDDDFAQAEAELNKHLASFGKTGDDEELKAAKKNHEPPAPTHALVIDGDTLKLVLDDRLRQKFLLLCKECRSVLCCRVSPSQKAAVVNLVKHTLEVMTLSIGDGANDVAMIQEADVGVGIAGEEGRQAVMSSDYAIGQFRYLTRLLLVHGRWDYRRMAECVANFFYKNIIWVFALFWYQVYANFDCSYAFDYSYILLFNLAFTSLPIIFQGILDQDVDDKVSLAVPQLYRRGIEQKEWTQTKFWIYMIDGFYQSVICFYFTYLEFAPANFTTESGRNVNDYKRLGVYIVNPIVLIVNVYILINTYRWDWFMCLITGISILLIWFWTGVYTAFTDGFTFYQAAPQVYGALSFWAVGLLTVILALLPRFAAKAFQKMYFPYDIDIVREQVRQGKFDYLKNADPDNIPQGAGAAGNGKLAGSTSSSEISNGQKQEKIGHRRNGSPNAGSPTLDEDMRPIYPPSEAGTKNPRSHNGSDGTDYTGHSGRPSVDPFASHFPPAYPGTGAGAMGPNATYSTSYAPGPVASGMPPSGLSMIQTAASSNYGTPAQTPGVATPTLTRTEYEFGSDGVARPSMDRPRPSFDRLRSSMDRTRASFEASNDFTSAAYLTRVESSQSTGARSDHKRGESKMRQEISDDLR